MILDETRNGKILYFSKKQEVQKCALRGCEEKRIENEIWCSQHQHTPPFMSCDNLPIVDFESSK
jgi:hypothetical protein